jgi:hypothetical protein
VRRIIAGLTILVAMAVPSSSRAGGDCCSQDAAPGCDATSCEAAVCAADAFCCDLQWDDVCAAQATVRCPETCADLDPFLCYKTRRNAAGEKFQARSVALANAFEEATFDARKPGLFCNPADVEGAAAGNSDDHLEGYRLRRAKGEPAHAKVSQLETLDRFGSLELRTVKEKSLLVPSAKSLLGPVASPGASAIEHFACYAVRSVKGADKFPKGVQAQAVDHFGQPKTYQLKKPTRLCVPSDKNGEGLDDDRFHLLCYRARRARGEPKHDSVKAIHVANQFGAEILDSRREDELCVAALVNAP